MQQLKAALTERSPKTVNKRADQVERRPEDRDGVGRDRAGAVLDSVAPRAEECGHLLRFRRVRTARRNGANGTAGVPGRAPWRGGWAAMRRDHGAGVAGRRSPQAATVRGSFRVEGSRDDAEGRSAAVRAVDEAVDGRASRQASPPRCARAVRRGREAAHAEGRSGDAAAGRAAREREAGRTQPPNFPQLNNRRRPRLGDRRARRWGWRLRNGNHSANGERCDHAVYTCWFHPNTSVSRRRVAGESLRSGDLP